MQICAVILAGGKSSRMGKNKTVLPLNNQPIIQIIVNELKQISDDIAIIANEEATYDFLSVSIYPDNYKGKGPLAGIESAMSHIFADLYLITAADMPFINKNIYQYLLTMVDGYDAVIPKFDGYIHPLAGIYRRTALPIIKNLLENDALKVRLLFEQINVKYVENFEFFNETDVKKHFFNMNNPAEYEQAKQNCFNQTQKE